LWEIVSNHVLRREVAFTYSTQNMTPPSVESEKDHGEEIDIEIEMMEGTGVGGMMTVSSVSASLTMKTPDLRPIFTMTMKQH
jgi:hypothetical protein